MGKVTRVAFTFPMIQDLNDPVQYTQTLMGCTFDRLIPPTCVAFPGKREDTFTSPSSPFEAIPGNQGSVFTPTAPSTISSAITCSGGSYPSEVGWSLSCSDDTTLSGGAPYTSSVPLAVALGATCTLGMTGAL